MKTTDLKKRILLNFLSSVIHQPQTYNWMANEVEKYIAESPNEVQLFLDEKELDRIKFGDR